MRVLVVTNPFKGRDIGDRITDCNEIEETLKGEHCHHVVQSDHDVAVDSPKKGK